MSDKTVKITIEVPLLKVADALCSAFESSMGAGYWCEIVKCHAPATLTNTLDGLTEQPDPKVYPHIDYLLNPGGYLTIKDNEDGERHKLTHEGVLAGLVAMAEKCPYQFGQLIGEGGDAITGDVLVQCAVFGDVVYE